MTDRNRHILSGAGAFSATQGRRRDRRECVVVVRCHDFLPRRIRIPVGGTVAWSFEDDGMTDTVTADDGSLDSRRRRPGEFRILINQPDDFRYHCAVHSYMVGRVTVG